MNKQQQQLSRARRYKLIRVQQVHPLDNFRAHFVFTDGSERDIDLDQYLHGPVFEPIRSDPELFRNMYVEGGTITWPGEVDIDPDTLYYGDEDPPWVKYDKEQALKAQRVKRATRTLKPRKVVNGKSKSPARPALNLNKTKRAKKTSKPITRKKVLAKSK